MTELHQCQQVEQSSIRFEDVRNSKPKTKFYSESENRIMTKSDIMKIIKVDSYWDLENETEENKFNQILLNSCQESRLPKTGFDGGKIKRNVIIPCDLQLIEKTTFYRDGNSHQFDCEFATGRSCNYWCGEKYHGMMGIGAEVRKQ